MLAVALPLINFVSLDFCESVSLSIISVLYKIDVICKCSNVYKSSLETVHFYSNIRCS